MLNGCWMICRCLIICLQSSLTVGTRVFAGRRKSILCQQQQQHHHHHIIYLEHQSAHHLVGLVSNYGTDIWCIGAVRNIEETGKESSAVHLNLNRDMMMMKKEVEIWQRLQPNAAQHFHRDQIVHYPSILDHIIRFPSDLLQQTHLGP